MVVRRAERGDNRAAARQARTRRRARGPRPLPPRQGVRRGGDAARRRRAAQARPPRAGRRDRCAADPRRHLSASGRYAPASRRPSRPAGWRTPRRPRGPPHQLRRRARRRGSREPPRLSARGGTGHGARPRCVAARVVGVTTTAGEIRARIVVGADGLHSHDPCVGGAGAPLGRALRYGLAGHWRLDDSGRDAVTVTLAGRPRVVRGTGRTRPAARVDPDATGPARR